MGITDEVAFFNVSTEVTPNNRPLRKSEYQLGRLVRDLSPYDKVVALGRTASEALGLIGVAHFRLPHPSPRNRQLNDKLSLRVSLLECKCYLEDWKNEGLKSRNTVSDEGSVRT